jgi:hypothetical protein
MALPARKSLLLMTVNMNARRLARKCSRKHAHVRIQGKFTKPSVAYCEGLAKVLANVFAMHLALEVHSIKVDGLEDVLTNDVLLSCKWEVVSSWPWRGSSHINLLEVASVLRSYEEEAKTGGDSRFVDCVDSNVELCALTRRRRSSNALRFLLKRASTLAVAFGLYPAGRFAPTRLNPGDHPTRDSVMLDPVASLSWTFPQSASLAFRPALSIAGLLLFRSLQHSQIWAFSLSWIFPDGFRFNSWISW